MPAKIDLKLSLPDGDVTARRDYPLEQETRLPSEPGRQADEHEWVAAELPGAVEQLYARAGLEQPRTPKLYDALLTEHEALFAKVRELIWTFPVPDRDRLAINHTPDQIIDETKQRIELLAGDADASGQHLDAIKDALRVSRDVPDADLAALVIYLAGASENDIRRRLARLAGMFGFGKDFDGMDEAVARELDRRRANAEKAASGRFAELRNNLTVLFGLPKSDSDNVNEIFLDIAGARDKQLAEARRRGQLDVLEALDVDAGELPDGAELAQWGARARQTWIDETRQPLESELSVTRSYLAGLLDKLDVGNHYDHDKIRSGELDPDQLAQFVSNGFDAAEEGREHAGEAGRLRGVVTRLLEFFELPAATPDEKIAERVINAATKAIGDDVADLAAQVEENAADLTMAFATLARIGEPFGALSAMEAGALREGRTTGQDFKDVANRLGRVMMDRYAEQKIMRALAGEVAELAGGSGDARAAVSDGSLAPQELANRLREYKAALRKGTPSTERDVYRRLLDDIGAKLGTVDGVAIRDTLLPGAVGDLVGTVEAQDSVLRSIREVLAVLRDGLDCADEDLPGLVRQTALTEGYPVGTVVELDDGQLAMVVEISADVVTSVPIVVRFANRQKLGVRPSEIRRIRHDLTDLHEQPRPGEFFTGDGLKARAFKLPENGLADILGKVRPPKLPTPDLEKIDEFADRVADRIETWGERVATRINAAADRLAAEIDEAVENATRKRDGGE